MVVRLSAALTPFEASALAPDFADEATRARVTPVAVSAFVRIADLWKLRAVDARRLMGDVSERTWFRMKRGDWDGVFTQDQLMRIGAAVGIFKGLHLLFKGDLADEWIKRRNARPLFRGGSPLRLMTQGGIPAILDVRKHVDALRGGL